jgi:hypothetical protein
LTGEKGGGLISLSAKKKPAALKAFYTYKTTTFCPNKGDRLIPPTFIGKICALYATPLSFSPLTTPAIIPATCVPCECSGSLTYMYVLTKSTHSLSDTKLSFKSGCIVSTPVSITATLIFWGELTVYIPGVSPFVWTEISTSIGVKSI